VFRLRIGNVHRRADANESKKFRRSLAFQPNAPVRARHRMHKALMKTIPRRKFTPKTHWIANVTARRVACGSRHDFVALHTETVGTRTFVFLFGVNLEIPAWRRLVGQPYRAGR